MSKQAVSSPLRRADLVSWKSLLLFMIGFIYVFFPIFAVLTQRFISSFIDHVTAGIRSTRTSDLSYKSIKQPSLFCCCPKQTTNVVARLPNLFTSSVCDFHLKASN